MADGSRIGNSGAGATGLAPDRAHGTRRFGRWNGRGTWTLAQRETLRFLNVWTQTLAAPLITAGLFLVIFAIAIGPSRPDVMGVPFLRFLLPGILMMTVIQNAFANTSSSIVVAKVQGNIVDTLMPPLSALEMTAGYLAGGIARGAVVAMVMTLAGWLVLGYGVAHPLWLLAFVVVGAAFLGALGIMAAIFAEKFDQMAAVTNFVITPLAFLSGTFYSVEAMPPLMARLIHWNPVFYLIDGARFGFIGASDSDPALGLAVSLGATLIAAALCWKAFDSGWRLKP